MNHNEIPEKPILMSGPMVLAILADLKTQTRRTTGLKKINEDPGRYLFHKIEDGFAIFYDGKYYERKIIKLPYGLPGNNLWVREKHQAVHYFYDCESGNVDEIEQAKKFPKEKDSFYQVIYAADHYKNVTNPKFIGGPCDTVEERGFAWRPSIFMYRWASRINLFQRKIRVERLHDISEADSIAEGVQPNCLSMVFKDGKWIVPENSGCPRQDNVGCVDCKDEFIDYGADESDEGFPCFSAKESFQSLWESINGPGSWAANPYLFVVEFERVK